MCDRPASRVKAGTLFAILDPLPHEELKLARQVGGRLGWSGRGQSDRQLMDREWAGEQRPAAVGWQVVAVVSEVEQHDQRTAVVAADLLTDRGPVLSRHVDHDHIRLRTLGQLEWRPNHVDGAFSTEQGEQLGAWPHASAQQGHALPHV